MAHCEARPAWPFSMSKFLFQSSAGVSLAPQASLEGGPTAIHRRLSLQ